MSENSSKDLLIKHLRTNSSGKVFYDFDNTLLLDNSTNLFFNTVRPRWLMYIVFKCIEFLLDNFKINRFKWEDFIKTLLCKYLFPHSYMYWYFFKAKKIAKEYVNVSLTDQKNLKKREVIVISFGHREIIEPILKYIDIDYKLVASRASILFPKNIRLKGKLYHLQKFLDKNDYTESIFVTDSEDDKELLNFFKNSFLVVWGSQTPVSYGITYVPFRYTSECKYVVRNIIWNQHLGEDYVILVLAYWLTSINQILCVFLLFISFFAIYEIGYFENDMYSSKKEEKPSLSGRQAAFINYPIYRYAILWAILCGLGGLYMLSECNYINIVGWFGILLLQYLLFKFFNALPPSKRIYLFPILQYLKTFSYVLVLPLNALGGVLLYSQMMRQTINYYIYRHAGNYRTFKRQIHRLLTFIIVISIMLTVGIINLNDILTVQSAVVILWLFQRVITRDTGGYKNTFRRFWVLGKRMISS
jgi:hypothetical protein